MTMRIASGDHARHLVTMHMISNDHAYSIW